MADNEKEKQMTTPVAKCSAASVLKNYSIAAALIALLSWAYLSVVRTPPPRVCGEPDGPPVTASRVILFHGRHLAYNERGVPKDQAKRKVIVVHGSGGSRHNSLSVSEELLKELSVYVVSYDRAGYGQSDPNPDRDLKSESEDVVELANKLDLGAKFYLVSTSIGGYTAWSCLKYIPHRLAGVLMFSPVTNFWWSNLPSREAYEAFKTQAIGDKLALLVAHYSPSFLYFWMTQRIFPTSSTMGAIDTHCNQKDREEMQTFMKDPAITAIAEEATQQGIFESTIRDMMVMFGNWEFDPAEIQDPSPAQVHIWQGDEDYLVPVALQRYVHRVLPWIHYHELAGFGHVLGHMPDIAERALRELLSP